MHYLLKETTASYGTYMYIMFPKRLRNAKNHLDGLAEQIRCGI